MPHDPDGQRLLSSGGAPLAGGAAPERNPPAVHACGRASTFGSATSRPASARPAMSAPASGASRRICHTETREIRPTVRKAKVKLIAASSG